MQVTLGRKLAALISVGTLGLAAVGTVGLVTTGAQADATAALARASAASDRQWSSDMAHDAIRGDVLGALLAGRGDASGLGIDELPGRIEGMNADIEAAAALLAGTGLGTRYADLTDDVAGYGAAASAVVELARRDPAAARAALPAFLQTFTDLETGLGGVGEAVGALVQSRERQSREASGTARILILVGSTLAVVVLVCGGWFLTAGITRSTRRLVGDLDRLAAKDLTGETTVDTSDEFARMAVSLNGARAALRDAFGQLVDRAGELTEASGRLAVASRVVVEQTEVSAERAAAVASAAEEVSSNVATVATSTGEVQASAHDVSGAAAEAVRTARQGVAHVASANAAVLSLEEAAAGIGAVTRAISTIAEQTNMLSLNARIEASRAGESGKGFAVVAGEVKQLAQQTGLATGDINARMERIRADVTAASAAMASVTGLMRAVDDTQQAIAGSVEEQSLLTAEITAVVADAAAGSREIAAGIAGLADAAHAATGSATAAAQATAEVAATATELHSLVAAFRR